MEELNDKSNDSGKKPTDGKPNLPRKDNAFVAVMKKIFVDEIVLKLIALAATLVLWSLTVLLGSLGNETSDLPFFEALAANFLAQFTGVKAICASVIDLVLLFALLYLLIHYLNKNKMGNFLIFLALLLTATVILTGSLVHFPVMGSVFGNGILIIVIIVVLMYSQELRRLMLKLSSKSVKDAFSTEYNCTEEELRSAAAEITKAVLNMSKDNRGAIIIMTTQSVPQHILDSGTRLNANLSQPLIECLFNTHADLHDGAVFIHGNKILAAGCFLPLSQSQSIAKELGTRHRAALGITEQYDVLAIVVSEETGIISVASGGKLTRYFDAVMLKDVLEQTYGLTGNREEEGKKRGRRK